MKQTEITVQVLLDINTAQKLLVKQGFKLIETFELYDYYFSKHSKNELKKLSYAQILNASFLLRKIKGNTTKLKLVYKNKTLDKFNNVVSEEKVESTIGNLNNVLKIFKLSNLNCWCELHQINYVYIKNNVSFLLQDAKDLGVFIEYEEDETMLNLTEEQKIDFMIKQLKQLNLPLGSDYSCKKVHLKFLKDN